MRRLIVLILPLFVLATAGAPAWAGDAATDGSGQGIDLGEKFTLTGSLRARWERLDNYFDFDDQTDDAFSFFPYRARLGVLATLTDNVQVLLEIQNFGSWGNQSPSQSYFFPPFQNYDGDGNSSGTRSSETALYQGFLKLNKIGGTGLGVTIGRQEYEFGDGLILGNEEYYNGTVFDGLNAAWDFGKWSLTGFYFVTNERNDLANYGYTSYGAEDQSLEGIVASLHPSWPGKGHLDGYLVNFQDGWEDAFKPRFWTLGGHWWRSVASKGDAGECPFDWNVEVAWQSGSATDPDSEDRLDLGGNVVDLGFGWNLVGGSLIHRIHGGVTRQSGDDNLTDNKADGWNALFPRTHGRFGGADYFGPNFGSPRSIFLYPPSGILAWKLGYGLTAGEGKHALGATVWWFEPAESDIQGFDANGDGLDDALQGLGTEFDLDYAYQYSRHVSLTALVAYLKPGDGLTFGNLPGVSASNDAITRVNLGATVKF